MKSQLRIKIELDGKRFNLSGCRIRKGRYLLKRGRSWYKKKPEATNTEICSLMLNWLSDNDTGAIGYEIR